jgi:hypothetical protein
VGRQKASLLWRPSTQTLCTKREKQVIFWNIRKLKQLLVGEGLSQRSCFHYLLLFGLVVTGGLEFMAYFPYDSPNVWRYTITIGYLICSVIGTILFYRANGGASGKDLFNRYMSLGLVVTIRLTPLMLLLMLGLGLYQEIVSGVAVRYPVTPIEASLTVGWTALVWARMVKHVRDVASA